MKAIFDNRQAVAFVFFLEVAILLGFFIKNLAKSLPLKDERSGAQQKDSGNLFNEENR